VNAQVYSQDVAWTFGNVGNFSYRLDSVTPADAGLGAAIGSENPTLTLQLGRRYQVTITNYQVHPFEVISKGSSASLDKVLLSMGSPVGSYESDPDVVWEDNNLGTVTFTLTYSLYNAMTASGQVAGYRCRLHATTMRGDFAVEGLPIAGRIEKGQIGIELEPFASGLAAPVDMKPSPDETGRLFVVDQAGKVYVIVDGQLQAEPFLDVTSRLVALGILGTQDENDYDERGLLGFAFHPDFADPGSAGYQKVYTYTSEPADQPADFTTDPRPATINHHSVVAEWTVDPINPNLIDIGSFREILRIDQPQFNHNGGMLAFGPDTYLYISLGDGGAADDSGDGHGLTGNGQNINTVHGSILRINPLDPAVTVDSEDLVSANGKYRIPKDNPFVDIDGESEIFAYGFRNPFRFSFDSETGQLIAADVGQNNVEEIDIVIWGGNYGWNFKEGTFRFNPSTGGVSGDPVGFDGLIDPVAQYDHDDGLSIIGGFVYRGSAIPELFGKYVFGDFSGSFGAPTGRLFYADLETGLIQELIIGADDRDLNLYVKGFGIDAEGEIYVLAGTNLGPFGDAGLVLKIVDF
jgi:glucose/arabinose dehydrogenase